MESAEKYYRILEFYNPNLLQDVINLLIDSENRRILKFLYSQRERIEKQLPPIVPSEMDSEHPKCDKGLLLLNAMEWEAKRRIENFNNIEYLSKRLRIEEDELAKRLGRMYEKNLVESYLFVNGKEDAHFLMTGGGYEYIRDNFLRKDNSWEV